MKLESLYRQGVYPINCFHYFRLPFAGKAEDEMKSARDAGIGGAHHGVLRVCMGVTAIDNGESCVGGCFRAIFDEHKCVA